MALTWPSKDPDEVIDYQIDWSKRLAGDTIVTSTWIIASGEGLTMGNDSKTNSVTTLWLSAGILGTKYILTNRVVTAGGRTMDQSVSIKIKSK